MLYFFFSSRRRHTRFDCDWSSDVCSSDLSLNQMMIANLDCTPMHARNLGGSAGSVTLVTRSFLVSARICREPIPRRLDNQTQILKLRFPTEFSLDLV